jgi:hypothetical protein
MKLVESLHWIAESKYSRSGVKVIVHCIEMELVGWDTDNNFDVLGVYTICFFANTTQDFKTLGVVMMCPL